MARSVPDAFIAAKNAEQNEPIWLYRFGLLAAGLAGADQFMAAYSSNVSFFKDTPPAHSSQTYTAYEIQRQGIQYNSSGSIESMQLVIGNADKDFFAWAESDGNGLRGVLVTVREVYATVLADQTAYLEDIFEVDSSIFGWDSCVLTLGPPSVLQLRTPGRTFRRGSCAWRYKGEGCWESDGAGGWQAPSGFVATASDLCQKTIAECERHQNETRYGAFPSLPKDGAIWL